MNDTELISLWSALEPSARRRARIETRVFEWLEASETSIAGEWLGLLKVEPLTGLAYASVGRRLARAADARRLDDVVPAVSRP